MTCPLGTHSSPGTQETGVVPCCACGGLGLLCAVVLEQGRQRLLGDFSCPSSAQHSQALKEGLAGLARPPHHSSEEELPPPPEEPVSVVEREVTTGRGANQGNRDPTCASRLTPHSDRRGTCAVTQCLVAGLFCFGAGD